MYRNKRSVAKTKAKAFKDRGYGKPYQISPTSAGISEFNDDNLRRKAFGQRFKDLYMGGARVGTSAGKGTGNPRSVERYHQDHWFNTKVEDMKGYNPKTGKIDLAYPTHAPVGPDAKLGKFYADKKHFDEKGFPRQIGNFRDHAIANMMKDGKVTYHAEKGDRHTVRTFDRIARQTGIPIERVNARKNADILNIVGNKGTEVEFRREKKDGTKLKPDKVKLIGVNDPDNWTKGTAAGISYNKKSVMDKTPDGMIQVNFTRKGIGAKRRKATIEHEIGHSMGLAGDFSAHSNDPSVMSYNEGKNTRLTRRDMNAISDAFAPYMPKGK